MTPPPLVSILIPAYSPRFFEPCLASAIAQTYGNVEIIVGDDSEGSDIRELVARRGDGRVRCLRNEARLGFHGNFARLFSLAAGRYVKFLNDDDVLHATCVGKMVAAFEMLGPRISLVASRRRLVDESGAELPDTAATRPMSARDCTFDGRLLGNELLLRSVNRIGEPSAAMFRRSDVVLSGNTLFRIAEQEYTCLADLALWLRLLALGSMAYLAAPMSFIRIHPGQLQESSEVAARCMVERFYLPRDSRGLGFLADEAEYRSALRIGIDLVHRGLAGTDLGSATRAIFEQARRQIEAPDLGAQEPSDTAAGRRLRDAAPPE